MTIGYENILKRIQQIGFILECYLDFIELQYMNDDFSWFVEFPEEYKYKYYVERCKS